MCVSYTMFRDTMSLFCTDIFILHKLSNLITFNLSRSHNLKIRPYSVCSHYLTTQYKFFDEQRLKAMTYLISLTSC